jgi:hypothetical protein
MNEGYYLPVTWASVYGPLEGGAVFFSGHNKQDARAIYHILRAHKAIGERMTSFGGIDFPKEK